MGDVAAGIQLLDYCDTISNQILPHLQQVADEMQAACAQIDTSVIYQGKAQSELSQFFDIYQQHVEAMVCFHDAAIQFLANVYSTFSEQDQLLAQQTWMNGGH
jgi:hypothetical protein